ncbi:hypothetical protein P5F80_10590 [Shouchella clausii]|uniref:Uncharacterized protein n=1 Tax=Shouchella clausii (strain KSM-K16) TaxID=66692 RepID=Q5WI95_SHOC1|nr:hypothetical protein [Shouchella clausii]MED4159598.1 hypothetical protein [Shouchella clausii]MED4176972.1 hypothetical protein [Shouchella clausii]BAD63910.1 hypothetical protein ABC1372 [Shouchella clausii KSM-K16]
MKIEYVVYAVTDSSTNEREEVARDEEDWTPVDLLILQRSIARMYGINFEYEYLVIEKQVTFTEPLLKEGEVWQGND